jgi:hypothetical protein
LKKPLNSFVKGRPLNARLFAELCDEMGSDETQRLFHTEVRWLSRGKVLSRLFELRQELQNFLDETSNLRDSIHDWKWLCKLAYIAGACSFEHFESILARQGDIHVPCSRQSERGENKTGSVG